MWLLVHAITLYWFNSTTGEVVMDEQLQPTEINCRNYLSIRQLSPNKCDIEFKIYGLLLIYENNYTVLRFVNIPCMSFICMRSTSYIFIYAEGLLRSFGVNCMTETET